MADWKITDIKVENQTAEYATDERSPRVAFGLESGRPGACLASAEIVLGDVRAETVVQTGVRLEGALREPFSQVPLVITARDDLGNEARESRLVRTGRMGLPWEARWITDGAYEFGETESPLPMTFRKRFSCRQGLRRAWVTATAIGVYELSINGVKAGRDYFAPGYTTYKTNLQYQLYDVTELLQADNEITAVVGGGWAVGRFTYNSLTRISAPRQALLLELFLEYEDGARERIVTDSSWQVTEEGPYRWADFYDGETYDATVDPETIAWCPAEETEPELHPDIRLQYGPPVRVQGIMRPVEAFRGRNGQMIYDFGQNFAGVISLDIRGRRGQVITVRHAETLFDGDICTASNRTAKATARYVCREGRQTYSPQMTYMGFRYAEVDGIDPGDVEVSALVLHSDLRETGDFTCSDQRLNRLQSLIRWSGKSNLFEVPTDCPQRDERLGWTGDISAFAPTACYGFDISGFLDKWLRDVAAEQAEDGGIPFVVPNIESLGPSVPTACWGDCCILVPWAEYEARGDLELLRRMYPVMKKYLGSVEHWAGAHAPEDPAQKRVWKLLFQFGDWNAPGLTPQQCMDRGPWVGTAFFARTSAILAETAGLLGYREDQQAFESLNREVRETYLNVFTDGRGTLTPEEFQTGYVLPLAFGIAEGDSAETMAENLARLVRENGDHLSTGFTGTPWLLFALADHGQPEAAWRLLYQDTCPSWLYEVNNGATTFWEGWDNIPEDAPVHDARHCVSDSGVSFNHYAYGSVGAFLYRRVLGLEPLEAGYRRFRVRPLSGGGLTWCQGGFDSPYGRIRVRWELREGTMEFTLDVPVSTQCEVTWPDGRTMTLSSGYHVVR